MGCCLAVARAPEPAEGPTVAEREVEPEVQGPIVAEREVEPEVQVLTESELKGPTVAEREVEPEVQVLTESERKAFMQELDRTFDSNVEKLLQHSAPAVKGDKECVLAAVKIWGWALKHVADSLKADKEVVLAAVTKVGHALKNAADSLKSDKEVVLAAVTTQGASFRYAPDTFKADKDFVLDAVRANGDALQFASEELRADRQVVEAAVKKTGPALKWAKGDLNQDPELLKVAGLWDDPDETYTRPEKACGQAALSLKFSLFEESTPYASEFVQVVKKDPFLSQFKMHNPNSQSKKSCDPYYTDMQHQCKGTVDTCTFPKSQNLANERPTKESCWRVAFRFHLQKAKETNGFMIQVEEANIGLGEGQKIESEMAKQVGVKVFRTYTNSISVSSSNMDKLSKAVKEWCDSDRTNLQLENIFIGWDEEAATRPKYGTL